MSGNKIIPIIAGILCVIVIGSVFGVSALLHRARRLHMLGIRRRQIPDLRAVGVDVERDRERDRARQELRHDQMVSRPIPSIAAPLRSEGNRPHQAFQ